MKKNSSLANALREVRKSLGWTLKEAEEASGVHLSYISAIENNRRGAGQETLGRLARAYATERKKAYELLGEFVRAKTIRDTKGLERKPLPDRSLKDLGFLGRAVFSAICNLSGRDLERSYFKLVEEDDCFQIDWNSREITKNATIQVGDRHYRIRLTISEETGSESAV